MKLPSWMQKAWTATGLNSILLRMIFKGAVVPTIALAAYQAEAWTEAYTTIGYVVAIMSVLSLPIQTRAKFIQAMFMSLLFTCTAAACVLLQYECITSARKNTTHHASGTYIGSSGGPQAVDYNPAASAVAGVFLSIWIYIISLIRGYRPALLIQTLQASVFVCVCSVYGPTFPDMTAGIAFVRHILYTFLTGYALATGVSLFIFPITSRTIAQKQMGGVLSLMKAIIAQHKSFMTAVLAKDEDGYRDDKMVQAESKKMKGLIVSVSALFGKMKEEIGFARKEFAIGKFEPKNFTAIQGLMAQIMLPMIGLSTFLGMTRTPEEVALDMETISDKEDLLAAMRKLKPSDWNEIFELSAEPYSALQAALINGLDHVSYVLGIAQRPRERNVDEEAKGVVPPTPGDTNFAQYLSTQIDQYHEHRQTVIQRWSEQKGIDLPAVFWQDRQVSYKARRRATLEIKSKDLQQQLYLQLFAEFVIHNMAKAVLAMVLWADERHQGISTWKLVNPGWRRIRKLLYASWWADNAPYLHDRSRQSVQMWVGDALKEKRDPEHLPPVTWWEKSTDKLRQIPKLLGGAQSGFALRATLCVTSVAIVAWLPQTAKFFIEQRGVWSLVMCSMSIGNNTGIGIWGVVLRVSGTVTAMVATIAIWYLCDQKPAAVIPVTFVWLALCYWFTLKHLKYFMIGIISMVTTLMIIGYELQIQRIGVKFSEAANEQDYHPVYILAPSRLVAILVGVAAAFFWTYLPYPVTTHSSIRRDLGQSLQLLAEFYSAVHSLIDIRMHQGVASNDGNDSPAAQVGKARSKVLQKLVFVLGQLRENSQRTKFDLTFGGRFPAEKYEKLMDSIQKIFDYLYLISYAADSFQTTKHQKESEWVQDFRRFTADISITSHRFTSILCQLSASVINSQALPPYLHVPPPEPMSDRVSQVDPGILSIEHIHEPSYAAFAALTVTSDLLSEELSKIVNLVRDLVGEVDFSYAMV